MSALSDWLHKLPAAKVEALRAFRASARNIYPDDPNPIARVFKTNDVPASIAAMPREFVLALDHE